MNPMDPNSLHVPSLRFGPLSYSLQHLSIFYFLRKQYSTSHGSANFPTLHQCETNDVKLPIGEGKGSSSSMAHSAPSFSAESTNKSARNW